MGIVGSSDGTAQTTPTGLQAVVAGVYSRVVRDGSSDERTVNAITDTAAPCRVR